MNFKKFVSTVSALVILGSTVSAFANTTIYKGPTSEKETRLSTVLGADAFGEGENVDVVAAKADMIVVDKYTGWSYHHAMQDAATSNNINDKRQSQLKINSNGFYLIGVNGSQTKTGGAYIAYKPAIGEDEVFYSFDVTITENGNYDLDGNQDSRAVKIGNIYESGLESGKFYANLTANGLNTTATHTVYMTFKPSNKYATISVDGTQIKKGTLDAASMGIFIQAPYGGERAANLQISNFKYGLVNKNADATYITGDIAQYKESDGYDKDATAVVLDITANETLNGFSVTHDSKKQTTKTVISAGSTVSIGAIVSGIRDRNYLNQRFTIGNIE